MTQCQEMGFAVNGRWTRQQHEKFLLGLQMYGKNWKKIEDLVKTRNGSQIRSHAQKFFLKTKKSIDCTENQMNSSDHHEVPSTFLNSKSASQTEKLTGQHSLFLEQIIKHSRIVQDFNLWKLIDTKDTKQKINQSQSQKQNENLGFKRQGSFNVFKQHESLQKGPRKILKAQNSL